MEVLVAGLSEHLSQLITIDEPFNETLLTVTT